MGILILQDMVLLPVQADNPPPEPFYANTFFYNTSQDKSSPQSIPFVKNYFLSASPDGKLLFSAMYDYWYLLTPLPSFPLMAYNSTDLENPIWNLQGVTTYFYNDLNNELIVNLNTSSLIVVDAITGNVIRKGPNLAILSWYSYFGINPVDGNLILVSDYYIISMSLVTFKIAWNITAPSETILISTSVMTEDGIIIVDDFYSKLLYAINCTDGSILWSKKDTRTSYLALLTTAKGNTVLITEGVINEETITAQGYLMSIDPATGSVLSQSPTFDGYLDSIIVVRNTIIFAHRTFPDPNVPPHGIYQVEYEKMEQRDSFSLICNIDAWIYYFRIDKDGTIYGLVNDYWNDPQGQTQVFCVFRPSADPSKPCPFPYPPNSDPLQKPT